MCRSIPIMLSVVLTAGAASAGPELYGTVRTTDGAEWTGTIVWDDERQWDQRLDAHKIEDAEIEESGFQLNLFGFKARIGGDDGMSSVTFAVPLGHLRGVEPQGRDEAKLLLKSGETVQARANTRDLGRRMRRLTVTDAAGETREFEWRRLQAVEFRAAPEGTPLRGARRIHGVVETDTVQARGFIRWDADETFLDEILDGEDDKGGEHEIEFSRIAAIEPQRRGARVLLRDGTTLNLHGTNDVDEGHRGIEVTRPDGGTVGFDWYDVRKVIFDEEYAEPAYDDFDGGRRLKGVVRTRQGSRLAGAIVWDQDERFSFETLDGEADGVEYSIPFASIAAIHPQGMSSAEVRLRDGSTLRLSGSNDVDADNRGVQVEVQGTPTLLAWDEVASVEFEP